MMVLSMRGFVDRKVYWGIVKKPFPFHDGIAIVHRKRILGESLIISKIS